MNELERLRKENAELKAEIANRGNKTYAYLLFELTMPSNNAWNGEWTGDEHYHAIVKKFPKTRKNMEKIAARAGLTCQYAFGDGWVAQVAVKRVSYQEATKAKKKSKGFAGYSWMADSVMLFGEIKRQAAPGG